MYQSQASKDACEAHPDFNDSTKESGNAVEHLQVTVKTYLGSKSNPRENKRNVLKRLNNFKMFDSQ